MKKPAFLVLVVLVLTSCSHYEGVGKKNERVKVDSQGPLSKPSDAKPEEGSLNLTPFGANCTEGYDLWVGKIQSSAQEKLYAFYDCLSEANPSLQIWESVDKLNDPSELLGHARQAMNLGDYKGFKRDCFTYEIDGEVKPETELERYDYRFPFFSKHYREIDGKWVLLDSSRIEDWDQFVSFQLEKVSGR